jgi:hypothetical protein
VTAFKVVAGYRGEAKRRQRRLREGKGGVGWETSGPVRRRWPEVHGGARRGRPSGGVRVSGVGGRRLPGSLTGWADVSVKGRRRETGPEWEGGDGPRLGWKRREEAGPKPLLGLKSNRVKENQF